MDMLLLTAAFPAMTITPSTILLIAGALCFLAVLVGLLVKKRPPKSPDNSAAASENTDYAALAAAILAGIGGKENLSGSNCCADRLRFEVRDFTAINEKAIKAAGAAGVTRPSKTSCQIVIGPNAQLVYDELKKLL